MTDIMHKVNILKEYVNKKIERDYISFEINPSSQQAFILLVEMDMLNTLDKMERE